MTAAFITDGDGTDSAAEERGSGFAAILDGPVVWLLWGLAMAAMGTRVLEWTWPPKAAPIVGLAVCAVAAMVLATPQRNRPVYISNHWAHRLLMHRNTVLPAAFVLLVALEPPTLPDAGIDTALLAGYLLLVDAATMPPAVFRRVASPLFLVVLVAVCGSATAVLARAGSASPVHRVLTAIIGLAVLGVAVAAAFLGAGTRRVGSRGPESPESNPSEVPR